VIIRNNINPIKHYDMKNKILIIAIILFGFIFNSAAQNNQTESHKIYFSNGYYFSDKEQNTLYTGEYNEYYDNGTLKLQVQIKEGVPEGTYVVYFENRKPQEIRSYKDGKLHGLWRTYDISGQLLSEAEYKNDQKHGTWRVYCLVY
jgi:antitoxin component YwqK of YwqJK toxin-antitoxin module